MKLQDFASQGLQAAQQYTTTIPGYITANTMNSILAKEGMFIAMQRIMQTDGHVAQNAMAAFFDPRSTDYNFIVGDPSGTGDAQIQLLDDLIAAGPALNVDIAGTQIDLATKLAAIKPTLIYLCNKPHKPFENATEADFALAIDDQARFTKINTPSIDQGWLRIQVDPSLNPDFKPYSAKIYKEVHGEKKPFNSFGKFENGKFPDVFINKEPGPFWVDDPYKVIINNG